MNAQSRIQRLLEDVLRQPGNDKCADCHAPSPRWASTNLGIFLCVQCASMHRRLGTHHSRVKSVTLDEWTREQVTHMRSIGNTKSNAIYNPDERRHPPPLQAAEERDSELFKYIRRKYELGAFKAGAAPALSQMPVNSRVTQQQARNVSGGSFQSTGSYQSATSNGSAKSASRPPIPRRPELADIVVNRDRDLPALPPSSPPAKSTLAPPPTRARAPTWSGDGLQPPRPTPVRSSSANALRQAPDLLVDTRGSSSATRPLQVNTSPFPTMPYVPPASGGGIGSYGGGLGANLQPPNATPGFAPLASPNYPAPSPLALGQQAFFSNNPFHQGMLSPAVVSPAHTGMSGGSAASSGMGQMNGYVNGMGGGMGGGMSPNGYVANGAMNGLPNGGMANGMANGGMTGMPTGMNGHQMNGGMNGMNGGMNGMNSMNSMNGMGMASPVGYSGVPMNNFANGQYYASGGGYM